MPGDQLARLGQLCSAFSFKYSRYVQDSGALCQLWLPDGCGSLSTQGSPYSVMGVSDSLALYKYMSGKYQPDSEGNDKTCPISRVFAGLQPQLDADPNSSRAPLGFDRKQAAQRCNIRSNLLLPVYDLQLGDDSCAVAVVELAQHEVAADMATAVTCLSQAAEAYEFFIPTLETAHSVDDCEVLLEPRISSETGGETNNSPARGAPVDPTLAGASAANNNARQSRRAMRRTSCLVVDPEPFVAAAQAPQAGGLQPQAAGGLRRPRRASVIFTDTFMPKISANTTASTATTPFAPDQPLLAPLGLLPEAQVCPSLGFQADSVAQVSSAMAGLQGQQAGLLSLAASARSGASADGPQLLRSVHWSNQVQQQQQQQGLLQLDGSPFDQRLLSQSEQWQDWQHRSPSCDSMQQLLRYSTPSPSSADPGATPETLQGLKSQLSRLQSNVSMMPPTSPWLGAQDSLGRLQSPLVDQYSSDLGTQRQGSMNTPWTSQLQSAPNSGSVLSGTFSRELLGGAAAKPADNVRALVGHGGTFKSKGRGGGWEYVGGAQKLVVLSRTSGMSELREQLCSLGYMCYRQCKIRYVLPGTSSSPTYVDLESEADVALMWEEWDEHMAGTGARGAKLQVYVDCGGHSYPSSGRDSNGSNDGGHQSLNTASTHFQPPTPTLTSMGNQAVDSRVLAALRAQTSTAGAPGGSKHVGEFRMSQQPNSTSSSMVGASSLGPPATSEPLALTMVSSLSAVPGSLEASLAPVADLAGQSAVSTGSAQQQQQQGLQGLITELRGKVEVLEPEQLDVVCFLGGGAFGEVYLARWHGTEVAVKCLAPSLLAAQASSSTKPGSDAAAAELLKEAAVLASLHHPNLVTCFGVVLPPSPALTGAAEDAAADNDWGAPFLEHGTAAAAGRSASRSSTASGSRAGGSSLALAPAMVTEYMAAGSLRHALCSKADWLNSNMAKVKMLLDTARGLNYLHSKCLVHFDLKSANLLVTIRDKVPCVKIADFGLTKAKSQTYVTGVDSLRGTLPWIAPEIIKQPHQGVTEAADVYSFGVIMWEVWTGQEPYEGVQLHALLHQLVSPAGLSLPVPGSPEWGDEPAPAEPAPGWAALMQQCWSAAHSRPTARELVGRLQGMMEHLRALKRSGSRGQAS